MAFLVPGIGKENQDGIEGLIADRVREHLDGIVADDTKVREMRLFRRQEQAPDAGAVYFDAEIVAFRVRRSRSGEVLPVAETDFEVALSVEGKAEHAGKLMFSFELVYAGVFRIVNVPKENLHPLVMIECPRLLFPFAREIIATAVRDGGFPPLMLDPVDFVGLYRQNMERQAAEMQASQIKPS